MSADGISSKMVRTGPPADEVSITRELSEELGPDRTTVFWSMILDMKALLLENRLAGECIEKGRIPRRYKDRYGVDNLYRYKFTSGYRACYTLRKNEDEKICALILELMDHASYERRFGYRGG